MQHAQGIHLVYPAACTAQHAVARDVCAATHTLLVHDLTLHMLSHGVLVLAGIQ